MGRKRTEGRRCAFESLEDRRLLAGDVTAQIKHGDLVIKGDGAANGITITAGATAGTVVITGVNAGGSATNVNGTANGSVTLSGFTDDLKIKLKGGEDSLTITGPLTIPDDADIDTGDGNDTVTITSLTVDDDFDLDLGKGDDTATLTSVTVSDETEIEASRGTDNVSIFDSTFDELDVEMGRGNDNLNITRTIVHDETDLDGGKGTNILTTGSGNSFADSDIDRFTVITNTPPTVDLNTVTPITENNSATLTGTFTDPDAAQTHTMVVDWDDPNNGTDSTFAIPATSGLTPNQTIPSSTDSAVLTITTVNTTTGVVTYSVQHQYADDGVAPGNNTASDNSAAKVTVTDSLADSGSDTATVTVNDVLPTITDPADTSVNENVELALSTTITDPGTQDTFTATVNWGDGQAAADTSPTLGASDFTDTVVGDTKFSWNHTTRVLTYKHTYLDDNPTATPSDNKNVVVTVRDDDSATTASQTTVVTVTNQLPTITDPADTSVNENVELALSTTITDPGTQDTFTATVNWGDGQAAADTSPTLGASDFTDTVVGDTKFSWNHTTRVLTYKHTYLDDNPTATPSDNKNVVVTVRDDDSATTASQTTVVTVTNQLPTITDPADTSVNENVELALSTTITDPGTQDTFTATVNWGDGQAAADTSPTLGASDFTDTVVGDTKFSWNHTTRVLTYKHTYLDDNPTATPSDNKNVVVTVRDDDSATTASQTTVVTVTNQLPTITDPADTSVNENVELALSTTITDPGTQDTFTATVNWGDGQAAADTSPTLGASDFTDTVVGDTKFSWNHTTRVLTYKHTYLDDNPTATPSDNKNVVVTVRDDDSATTATQTTTVTVKNVAPTVALDSVSDIDENDTVTLTGNFTDIGLSDVHTVTVNWGDPNVTTESVFTVPATKNLSGTPTFTSTSGDGATLKVTSFNATTGQVNFSVQHQYLDDGPSDPTGDNFTTSDESTITVTVADDDGQSGSDTATFTVSNVSATISVDAVSDIDENDTVTLTGSFTDIGMNDAHLIAVDWDDPNTIGSEFNIAPTVLLNVNDVIDSDSGDGAVLTITSINPTTGEVDFSVAHQYLDDGESPGNDTTSDSATIEASIVDDDDFNPINPGFSDSDTTTFTVSNVLPQISDPADTSIDEASELTLSTTITDPGTLDEFTATVDWGDGQAAADTSPTLGTSDFTDTVVGDTKFSWDHTTRVLTYKHTYLDDDPTNTDGDDKTVTVTVHDDDSTTNATQTTTVTVNNVLPTITDPADTDVDENTELTLSTTITDPGTLDEFTATVDWGDGQAAADTSPTLGTSDFTDTVVGDTKFSWDHTTRVLTYKHTYLDDDPTNTDGDDKTVTVTVHDDDSTTNATQTTTVTVNNVAPQLTAPTPATQTIDEGGTATLTTTFSDVGTKDLLSVEVDWGDGKVYTAVNLSQTSNLSGSQSGGGYNFTFNWTASSKTLVVSHNYLGNAGASGFTVTLTPSDDDGGIGTQQPANVKVNNVAATVDLTSTTPAPTQNTPFTLTGNSFTDPGLKDGHTLIMTWGDGSTSTFTLSATNALVLNTGIAQSAGAAATFKPTNIDFATGKVDFEVTYTYAASATDITIDASITDGEQATAGTDSTATFSIA